MNGERALRLKYLLQFLQFNFNPQEQKTTLAFNAIINEARRRYGVSDQTARDYARIVQARV